MTAKQHNKYCWINHMIRNDTVYDLELRCNSIKSGDWCYGRQPDMSIMSRSASLFESNSFTMFKGYSTGTEGEYVYEIMY